MEKCYCGSVKIFKNCCESILLGNTAAATPEILMRSRYTAYVLHKADYLIQTTHISQLENYSKEEILEWAKENTWDKLEVLQAFENIVEFKAYFINVNNEAQVHHEKSTFKKEDGIWYYVDGVFY
jgi:SEC-C motif domain protein